jgi:xylulose-5-phosphate/fructose-6-phosphate phosphoketolase
LLTGYGYKPYLVEGHEPAAVHQQLAATMDTVFDEIAAIQRAARVDGATDRARDDPAHLAALRAWMLSYRPQELFEANGAPKPSIVDWLPQGEL